MNFRKLKGTYDLTGAESAFRNFIIATIRETAESYGYENIVFPVMEYAELFAHGAGETSDIVVKKEMYTFEDRGGRMIALRPEGTASAVRAYLENNLSQRGYSARLYYIGDMFRAERPQAGRFREFTQFGVENIGDGSPLVDAELIAMNFEILTKLGLDDSKIYLNSIGDLDERAKYLSALQDYFLGKELCEDCRGRLETNALRILDCKNESCRTVIDDAPVMLDFLGEETKAHFEDVKSALDSLGVSYVVDPQIVRGLDYYNRTVFEIKSDALGAQSTMSGGGRYDNMVAEFGGQATPAAGFAIGLERLSMAVSASKDFDTAAFEEGPTLYVAGIGSEVSAKLPSLLKQFRSAGISAATEFRHTKLKKHMNAADKMNAGYVLFVGGDEIEKGIFSLRNMKSGVQTEGSIIDLISALSEE